MDPEVEISSSDVWMSQEAAAQALDKTTRYIRELVSNRKLVGRRVPRQGKPDELQVSAASVQDFKNRRQAERQAGSIAAVNEGAAMQRALQELGAKVELAISSSAHRGEVAISTSANHPELAISSSVARDWLTLTEAAQCGLPESYLLQMIESGELPARNVGRRGGGTWRVKRQDVEAITGQAQGGKGGT